MYVRRERLLLSSRATRLVLLVLAISLLTACGQSDGGLDNSPPAEEELRPEVTAPVETIEESPPDEVPDEPPAAADEIPPDGPASVEAIEEGPADGGLDEPPAAWEELPPEIAALVEAIEAGVPEALIDSAITLWVGCATMIAAGSPPECLNGDPEGTEYEVFPTAGCQGGWAPANTLARDIRTLVDFTGPLHAVVSVGAPAPRPHGRGDILLIYEAGNNPRRGVLFGLEAGQLVRLRVGCATPEQMTMGNSSSLEHMVIFRPDPDGEPDESPAAWEELSPEIAALVEAIEAGMPEALIDSAITLRVGCATTVAAGSPPECLNGDPEGTEYEVFPEAGCQGGWTPANVLAETLRTVVQNTGPLYAVVAVGAPAPHPHGRGDTLLVFEAAPPVQRGSGVLFPLEAGQLVRFAIGCNTPEQMTMGDISYEHTVIFRPDPDGEPDESPAAWEELPPEIAALVEAIEAGMPEALIDSAITLRVGCATTVAAGSPPECLNGDPEGTEYEVFPGAGCQPGWTPANVLAETLRTLFQYTGPLHAVVAVGAPDPHPHGRGDILLVYEAGEKLQRGTGVLFGLEAGQLVRFQIGCATPEQLTMGHSSSLEHTVIFRPDPDGQ